jgi:hypothetical protein
MNNPARILTTLDRHLDHPVSLVLFGRAAICLGYSGASKEAAATQDVDAILQLAQLESIEQDVQFWEALAQTNQELEPEGLYITHLFQEDQVFLRREWAGEIVPIRLETVNHLVLFRPATIDLILTKMMRGRDPEDMKDIRFLLGVEPISRIRMQNAFSSMRPIETPELQDAFLLAMPLVLEMCPEQA